MSEIEIELDEQLLKAIEEHRGPLSVSEFVETAMWWFLNSKSVRLNKEVVLKDYGIVGT